MLSPRASLPREGQTRRHEQVRERPGQRRWGELATGVALSHQVTVVQTERNSCFLTSSERQRTQNVLRLFLDPLLDVLAKLGSNAYLPLRKTDRSLQALLALLRTCPPRGALAPDGEDGSALAGHSWWLGGEIRPGLSCRRGPASPGGDCGASTGHY